MRAQGTSRPALSWLMLRYVAFGYLRSIFVVLIVITTIALGLDLLSSWKQVARSAPDNAFLTVLYYAGLRTIDIATNLSGVTIFIGVLWWEISSSGKPVRIALMAAGQSPLQRLIPALIVAIGLGSTQLVMDLVVRPWALTEQISQKLGVLGVRYDKSDTNRLTWANVGNDVFSARINYGPPAVLNDLTIYRFSADSKLQRVVRAQSAIQSSQKGVWLLRGAYLRYDVGSSPGEKAKLAPDPESTDPDAGTPLRLGLDPNMFRSHDVAAKYLPQHLLIQLANQPGTGPPLSDYRTWIQLRYARPVMAALLLLLAASTCYLIAGRNPSPGRYIVVFLSGYIAFTVAKLSGILGELAIAGPVAAAWSGPLITLLAIIALQVLVARKIV